MPFGGNMPKTFISITPNTIGANSADVSAAFSEQKNNVSQKDGVALKKNAGFKGIPFESGYLVFRNGILSAPNTQGGKLAKEKGYGGYMWGATNASGKYSLTMTLQGESVKRVKVFFDETAKQWATKAYIDNDTKNVITNNGSVWLIEFETVSVLHTVTFTDWSVPNYNACITYIDAGNAIIRFDEQWIGEISSTCQQLTDNSTPTYSKTPNTGSLSILDNKGELLKYIEEEIFDGNNIPVKILVGEKNIQSHIGIGQYDFGKRQLKIDMQNKLTNIKGKFGGRKLNNVLDYPQNYSQPYKTNLWLLLSEMLADKNGYKQGSVLYECERLFGTTDNSVLQIGTTAKTSLAVMPYTSGHQYYVSFYAKASGEQAEVSLSIGEKYEATISKSVGTNWEKVVGFVQFFPFPLNDGVTATKIRVIATATASIKDIVICDISKIDMDGKIGVSLEYEAEQKSLSVTLSAAVSQDIRFCYVIGYGEENGGGAVSPGEFYGDKYTVNVFIPHGTAKINVDLTEIVEDEEVHFENDSFTLFPNIAAIDKAISIDDMCNGIAIIGDNKEHSVKDYLQNITLEYAFVNAGDYSDIIDEICAAAQLNMYCDDNNSTILASTRPRLTSADKMNIIVIPKRCQYSSLSDNVITQNKYDSVSVSEQTDNVDIDEIADMSLSFYEAKYDDDGNFTGIEDVSQNNDGVAVKILKYDPYYFNNSTAVAAGKSYHRFAYCYKEISTSDKLICRNFGGSVSNLQAIKATGDSWEIYKYSDGKCVETVQNHGIVNSKAVFESEVYLFLQENWYKGYGTQGDKSLQTRSHIGIIPKDESNAIVCCAIYVGQDWHYDEASPGLTRYITNAEIKTNLSVLKSDTTEIIVKGDRNTTDNTFQYPNSQFIRNTATIKIESNDVNKTKTQNHIYIEPIPVGGGKYRYKAKTALPVTSNVRTDISFSNDGTHVLSVEDRLVITSGTSESDFVRDHRNGSPYPIYETNGILPFSTKVGVLRLLRPESNLWYVTKEAWDDTYIYDSRGDYLLTNSTLAQYLSKTLLSDYQKGIRTAKLTVGCCDYSNEFGDVAKDWENKGEVLQVGDVVRIDADNNGTSLSTYANGLPRYWRITGRTFRKQGCPYIDLELQESK